MNRGTFVGALCARVSMVTVAAGIGGALVMWEAAVAADLSDPGGASYKDAPVSDDFFTRAYLFGDWGGIRSSLKNAGVTVVLSGVNETVGNVSGGTRTIVEQASQLAFGSSFDMNKLAGIQGGTIGLTLSARYGRNQAADAGIETFQLTDEVYGRGNIARLTELYYKQTLFNDVLEIKGGRLPVGSDFEFQHCDFMHLSLCGGQPGNIAGDYIYNFPVSQWAGVVKVNTSKNTAFQIGFYDRSNEYLETKPSIALFAGFPDKSLGTLIPMEFQIKPTFGRLQPGDWRFGGWYSTESHPDVGSRYDVATGKIISTGNIVDGRSGVYFSINQQISVDDRWLSMKDGGSSKNGLTLFINGTFADEQTNNVDRQINIGLIQHGTFYSRPDDDIAIGFSDTRKNPRNDTIFFYGKPVTQGTESVIEAWYGWQATGWMNIHFDVEYDMNPGGFTDPKNRDALLFGAKTSINF